MSSSRTVSFLDAICSAIWTYIGSSPAVLAVVNYGTIGEEAYGARFRQSMWDDVCSWIALRAGDQNLCSLFAAWMVMRAQAMCTSAR